MSMLGTLRAKPGALLSDTTVVVRESPCTDGPVVMVLPVPYHDFLRRFALWDLRKALIQDAFPMLDVDQREFLLTGIGPHRWDELFPDEPLPPVPW